MQSTSPRTLPARPAARHPRRAAEDGHRRPAANIRRNGPSRSAARVAKAAETPRTINSFGLYAFMLAVLAAAIGIVASQFWGIGMMTMLMACALLAGAAIRSRAGSVSPVSRRMPVRAAADVPGIERTLLAAAGITHELRTPLTILKGRLHALLDGVIPAEPDEPGRLLRQVDHILRIVDDLDTLAQTHDGRLLFDRATLDLGEIARDAAADLRPLIARHGIALVEDHAAVRATVDPVRMAQVFANLLTNAAKHSRPGGRVTVRLRRNGRRAVIQVLDEGPGFLPEDRPHLFTPYWRSARTKRDGIPGSGMGLALTASLVAAQGGRIVAANRRDRTGACFTITLPADDVAA